MKKRYVKLVIAGLVLPLLLLTFGILFVTSSTQPEDFRTHTGTVAEFSWHDERWYEGFLSNSGASRFTVRLEDGSYYEATGVFYDQIDRELFSTLSPGKEIEISYHVDSWRPNKICGILYQGQAYLSCEDTLDSYYASSSTRHTIGLVLIIAGGIMYVAGVVCCCKYIKRRKGNTNAHC